MIKKSFSLLSVLLVVVLLVGSFSFANQAVEGAELEFVGLGAANSLKSVSSSGASLVYEDEMNNIPKGIRKKFEVHDGKTYILEFNGPITEDQKKELTAMKVVIGDYIPQYSFIVQADASVAEEVLQLDFIKGIKPFLAIYKIDPKLFEKGMSALAKANIEYFTANGKAENRHQSVKKKMDSILDLALSHEVVSITAEEEFQVFNQEADKIIKSDVLRNSTGLNGTGQIVAVCDTGLSRGKNDSSMHLDFQGRIKAIYALGRSTADDPHGHGTHVAGSVLGSGARSSGAHKGIAPGATLVFQSVLDSAGGLGGLPSNLNDLFAQAWNQGARIHTNSWGSDVAGAYTTSSRQVDEYVWNNDMTILIANGNAGPSTKTVGSPATAKNAISVGASENYRPSFGSLADNINQMASFSSRGYTKDGRVKPDVVAPGTYILSTRSELAGDSSFWANYNSYYAYMGGTSMATPVTAGAVALLRENFISVRGITPKPSLIKAALIASATDMGMGYPSPHQGWGRVNIDKATRVAYVNEGTGLATGQSANYTFNATAGKPLKFTLVWTDYPGSTTATNALVNDIDLIITAPDGTQYVGNDFSSPYNNNWDYKNNVENVFINSPQSGTYQIEINAYNVPQGPQKFSLAVINE
ncbi:S8 family serine peptidase [Alkaliphilus hydrothermalis]|uniref:Subtilisin family serine protease n=1 Tax=Alkaliphilus hydrothermalis TaxID=1482730 RepID=A0ABS2NLZ6_9FIRM|nr:S8 family serine peptidase [Alkaliphilus hydrothermalis]MBM7613973.1 subtilisin family serine protease [Alkaliphilus hydrothermalis]